MPNIYNVKIHNKELECSFCQGISFFHKEIFLIVENPGTDVRHLRNYFECIHCGEGRIFADISYYDAKLEDYFYTVHLTLIEED